MPNSSNCRPRNGTPPNEADRARPRQPAQRKSEHRPSDRRRKGARRQKRAASRFAIPASCDPALAEEIDLLARLISGERADPTRIEGGRRIAEPQIDLVRVEAPVAPGSPIRRRE